MYTRCPKCSAEQEDPGRDFKCASCGSMVKSLRAEFVLDEEAMGPLASIGLYEGPRWKGILLAIQSAARLAAIVLFALSLALCFVALFVGIPEVFGGAPGSDLGEWLFILVPLPLAFAYLSGTALLVYYSLLVAALLGSIITFLWLERRELRAMLSTSVSRFRAPDRSSGLGLVQLPQIFLAIFFIDMLWVLLMALSDTTPRTPPFSSWPDWYAYLSFASASVYEELAARVLLLGIPLLLAYYLAGSTLLGRPNPGPPVAAAPRTENPPLPAAGYGAHPEASRPPAPPPQPASVKDYLRGRSARGLWGYILGGGFRIGPLEAFFLVGSSLMFGYAHVPGWDLWKVIPTFIAGLGFAYLFLKVGLHAAILLHFAFDYLGLAYGLLPSFAELEILVFVLWAVVGAFYFWHYAVQAARWATGLARSGGARGEGPGAGGTEDDKTNVVPGPGPLAPGP